MSLKEVWRICTQDPHDIPFFCKLALDVKNTVKENSAPSSYEIINTKYNP